MPKDELPLLTDDYVAELLAKEAADCSLGYSAMGLNAYSSSQKRPANQPKPNTRFLNNIIRDTNSHNRALLAKESAESQARLRDLEHAEEKKRGAEEQRQRRLRPGPSDTRKRMLGDIAAIVGQSSKKRRIDDGEHKSDDRLSRNARKELFYEHDGRRKPDSDHRPNRNARKELFSERDGKYAPMLSGNSRHRDERSRERHHRHSERRRRSRDSSEVQRSHDPTADMRLGRPPTDDENLSDSDPLDDIIGPSLPKPASPVRKRGRGATIRASGIDRRFASGYDPKEDVSLDPDEEDDDWDSALEAVRDRQKWKQQGAERLRAAGFTEDQINKWETGGGRNEEDVRWTKKGEEREWDRGKSVELDGSVKIRTRV